MNRIFYPVLRASMLLLSLWIINACEQHPTAAYPADPAYFPLETGRFTDYLVTEERYSLSRPAEVIRYHIRELTGQPYQNATGQVAYRLHRFRRADTTGSWQADSLWSVYLTPTNAYRTESNVTACVLAFPIFEGQQWQTGFANQPPNTAFLRNIRQPFSVLGKTYAQTVTVIEAGDSTLVGQHGQMAVYAPDIGLIYRQRTSLSFCTETPACISQRQIDYGIRQTFQLIKYGKE